MVGPGRVPVMLSQLRWVRGWMPLVGVVLVGCAGVPSFRGPNAPLRKALTFYASFDRGTDAEYAQGDPWLYHASALEARAEARPGLPEEGPVRVDPAGGRFGGALRFGEAGKPVVYYRAAGNVPWAAEDWSGTISFWLQADPAELAEGFCDPIQVTPRRWDDAALFVEFERRGDEAPFRLGAYADYRVWNPQDRKWSEIPAAERPLVSVPGPPFSGDRWTHVAIVWERFNSGRPDGAVTLYLNGAPVGALRGRRQTFTWAAAQTRMLLGVGYVGGLDELAVFNRALTAEEIQEVRRLPRGIRTLLQP